jgi:hypothetical protein
VRPVEQSFKGSRLYTLAPGKNITMNLEGSFVRSQPRAKCRGKAMQKPDLGVYRFIVKEGHPASSGSKDIPLSIACEPDASEMGVIDGKGMILIRLKKGITWEQGHAIAEYLQDKVEGFSFLANR